MSTDAPQTTKPPEIPLLVKTRDELVQVLLDRSPELVEKLTPRQRMVLRHLLAGRSINAAASEMSLSAHTAHDHQKAIYTALGVHSREELFWLFITPICK